MFYYNFEKEIINLKESSKYKVNLEFDEWINLNVNFR